MTKILYVADGSSPIAQNWIHYFVALGYEIEVVSRHRVFNGALPGVRVHYLPFSSSFFSRFSTTQMAYARNSGNKVRRRQEIASDTLRYLNHRLGLQSLWNGYVTPLEARRSWGRVQEIADTFQPDLVHALRIPPEGYSVAKLARFPVIVSIWGNDLTLHNKRLTFSHPITRLALQRADGLHADCARDIRLAHREGYALSKPTLVVPTAGGIQSRPVDSALVEEWRERLTLPANAPIVINPRGVRSYVRLDEFFRAIPLVLQERPGVVFVCIGMQGHPLVQKLVQALGIEKSVRLVSTVSQDDLAALFKLSTVMLSPTVHDGTPNTLLEAMAQGTFPAASDLESIREWIIPGVNGLVFDPKNPGTIARATLHALSDPELRERARVLNLQLIHESADYETCMQRALEFYDRVIQGWQCNHVTRN